MRILQDSLFGASYIVNILEITSMPLNLPIKVMYKINVVRWLIKS